MSVRAWVLVVGLGVVGGGCGGRSVGLAPCDSESSAREDAGAAGAASVSPCDDVRTYSEIVRPRAPGDATTDALSVVCIDGYTATSGLCIVPPGVTVRDGETAGNGQECAVSNGTTEPQSVTVWLCCQSAR